VVLGPRDGAGMPKLKAIVDGWMNLEPHVEETEEAKS